ncbi:hypothetical protein PTKIN_Ptkin15bG0095500 [Pterospermum kingtungense]
MARRETSLQGTLDHDHRDHRGSRLKFVLQIRKFLKDDNGNIVGECVADGIQEEWFLPDFEFGSYGHRKSVNHRLRKAGCRNRSRLRRMLDAFFSDMKLILEREKENDDSEYHGIPRITLCVKSLKLEVVLRKSSPSLWTNDSPP